MAEPVLLCTTDARGVATVAFNRPQVNNAYNSDVILGLIEIFGRLAADDAVRLVVLRGNGRHFQAGADLKWLREVAAMTPEENLQISRNTTDAARGLNEFPKPTVALVHGGCFGGGTGIVAGCDIVVASEDAVFSITEARWGVMAGPIFPQLNAAIGEHNVRRYALTCERFGAARAREMGLVDEVCAPGALDEAAAPLIEAILGGGPGALRETKRLIKDVAKLAVSNALAEKLALQHALKRQTEEAEEGLRSFVEKRSPNWYPGRG
ncbi:MAG: enoyl-CoA hydratase [Alphaproteobacteria bacterium]|nr:enoyl-CoA hydratase [Alphaproteobacteria bacterium]